MALKVLDLKNGSITGFNQNSTKGWYIYLSDKHQMFIRFQLTIQRQILFLILLCTQMSEIRWNLMNTRRNRPMNMTHVPIYLTLLYYCFKFGSCWAFFFQRQVYTLHTREFFDKRGPDKIYPSHSPCPSQHSVSDQKKKTAFRKFFFFSLFTLKTCNLAAARLKWYWLIGMKIMKFILCY